MPKISVIVPVYKVEPYIRRCVDSILNQSFQDFELILVDDGSPDGCGAICEEYAQGSGRIHVVHQQNGGLSAARNAGIDWAFANSGSQWLAFVDSDDWIHPEYLQRLYAAVVDTHCRISACGIFHTDGKVFPPEQLLAVQEMSADDYYCSQDIHGGVTAVAWNKLYHKSLFSSLRYPVGKLHEDEFTTYLAVYEAGRVAVVPQRLYAYFQNPEGIMRSDWNPRRMHTLEAVEQQIAFAQRNHNARLLNKAVEQYIYSSYEQLEKIEDIPEYRQYQKVLRKKLRGGLALGRSCGVFPMGWKTMWAYEKAYPFKPLWWLAGRIKSAAKK